jgi:hypothetical protein
MQSILTRQSHTLTSSAQALSNRGCPMHFQIVTLPRLIARNLARIEPSRHGLFAEHQIADLAASRSPRVCADDSALVSAKCLR